MESRYNARVLRQSMETHRVPDHAQASPEKLKQLRQQREKMITRLFLFMLELIGIFGGLAVIGALVGKRLGGAWLYICLLLGFILSWVVVAMRYRRLFRRMKAIDQEIAELKDILEDQAEN